MSGAGSAVATGGQPSDPGLQPERTALAWQRTGLAAVLAASVALRDGVLRAEPLVLAAGVLALAAALVVVHRSHAELPSRVQAFRDGGPLPAPTGAAPLVLALLLLGAATLALLVS